MVCHDQDDPLQSAVILMLDSDVRSPSPLSPVLPPLTSFSVSFLAPSLARLARPARRWRSSAATQGTH
eukprot:756697-Hanusia_phi.AAC.1